MGGVNTRPQKPIQWPFKQKLSGDPCNSVAEFWSYEPKVRGSNPRSGRKFFLHFYKVGIAAGAPRPGP